MKEVGQSSVALSVLPIKDYNCSSVSVQLPLE